MINLKTSIELNGEQVEFGCISGADISSACFSYAPSYLADKGSRQVSISLPLTDQPFTPEQTRIFFEGLLPEGFTRRTVASWMRIDELDYLSILAGLGNECIGAIRICRADDEIPEAGYEVLSEQRVKELAAEGATKSAEIVTEAHLSLTGASGKAGLLLQDGKWYLPKGMAPSTHIVKQSHIRYDSIVVNEQLALLTAQKLGINTPNSFIINIGSGQDNEVLFASERYDRLIDDHKIIDGISCPYRLHQEDFAQAMGISAMDKYEQIPEQRYLPRMFEVLRQYSSEPIQDQLKLWDMVVYNYLVGNTDSHLKNYALLYGKDLNDVRLAPAYDIVSTCVYENCTRNLPYSIAGKYDIRTITRDDFTIAAKECGIGEKPAINHFDRLSDGFEAALGEATEEMKTMGFTNVESVRERVLKSKDENPFGSGRIVIR